MTFSDFRTAFLATLFIALQPDGGALAAPPASTPARKPNVIIIVADDLGYADVGSQQISRDVKTPNIDSIAANGVRFTNGYVSCPVCSPTRAGLLTGRYQQRFGFEQNPLGQLEENEFGLPLDQITIPQQLKTVGYATGMVGKWHLGHREGMPPTKRGFDEFFGFLGGAHRYVNNQDADKGPNALRRNDTNVAETEYLTDAFSREAVAFVERHKDEPFFLYLPYNAVHTPQQVPQRYLARFPGEQNPKRLKMLAMLSAMDDGVGKVLEKVREKNLEDQTLIIFLSDNGGPTGGNGSRNTPLRGTKGTTLEGGIRIPFMIQWKGKIKPHVEDRMIIQLDLFPTIMGVAGAQVPKDRVIDGVDLMPYLVAGKSGPIHETLYWRFSSRRAIRIGDMKLQWTDGEPPHLYNLSKDVGEANDLAAADSKTAQQLMDTWKQWNAQLMKPKWKGRLEGGPQDDREEAGETKKQDPPLHDLRL